MENVTQFKDLTLTYYGPAGGTFTILTDMPGSAMSVKRTINLPATTAERETKTFPLDNPALIEGRLIQFRATSTGVLILYDGWIRYRRVGTYIDGAAGEKWETPPMSLG